MSSRSENRKHVTMPRSRLFIKLIFGIGFAAPFILWCILTIQRGGLMYDPTDVKDFSLCQANVVGEKLEPLSSLVFTPTSRIYACGYLEVTYPSSWNNVCLAFYVDRMGSDRETVFRSESYCIQAHSQYFVYPITTSGWGFPNKYRVYVYDIGTRNWLRSVAFEIIPAPPKRATPALGRGQVASRAQLRQLSIRFDGCRSCWWHVADAEAVGRAFHQRRSIKVRT